VNERLNPLQRTALELLVAQEQHGYRNGEGVASMAASALMDGQAWIHFQTARALERRGLVTLDYTYADEGACIWLTDVGRSLAHGGK